MSGDAQGAEESKEELVDTRKIEIFEDKNYSNYVMFSEQSPKEIVKLLTLKLKDKDVIPELNDKKWKLTFTKVAEQDDQDKEKISA
jgi:hypothetical protein